MVAQPTDIYGSVDGTGPSNDTEYANAFANSHVRTRFSNWHGRSFYVRGPDLDGEDTHVRAQAIKNAVKNQYTQQGSSGRIFLSGYSRGAAAVVQAANLLNDDSIPVHALLLFDAVDRARGITRTTVPANVSHCFHALRSPAARSREFFGNCSHNDHAAGVAYTYKHFFCTHGGVGGTPWPQGDNASSDFIDEGREGVGTTVGSIGGLLGRAAGGAADAYMMTSVTYAQDQAGARESGSWMTARLATVL